MDKHQINQALEDITCKDFYIAALNFWNTLGYISQRQPEEFEFSFAEFKASCAHDANIREDKALSQDWKKLYLLFQVTDEELRNHFGETEQPDIFGNKPVFSSSLRSYLFAAIELVNADYNRTKLADLARQINRCYAIPLILTIKHGSKITIAVVNRRENKRHKDKDVLEKVTLIKDIDLTYPHRAHIEILYDLAIENLSTKTTLNSFDDLHRAWVKTLDLQELNKRFYRELSNWYFWALDMVEFPPGEEQDPTTRNSIAVIRLITRLIFVWFMKEKQLIPDMLFDPDRINHIIKFEDYNGSSYYKAILQNLFFATLNTEMNHEKADSRRFRREIKGPQNPDYHDHSLFRYEDLFIDPSITISKFFGDIPFLNGGLFECLDTEKIEGKATASIRIDGFSDRKDNVLKVPDSLFLQTEEQDLDLNSIYGTTGKRYKVRGLLSILHSYKFTVAENTPVEEEVALDPELLGRVFENLLASYNPETRSTARHDTGSFYTPREIVDFMVDESLVAHLSKALQADTDAQRKDNELRLRLLIAYVDENHLFSDEEAGKLIEAVDNLKAIDPACGSGAFLMGLLLKMVYVLHKLDPQNQGWKDQQIKKLKEQIQSSRSITDFKLRSEVVAKLEESIRDIEETFDDYDYDYSRKLFLIEHCIYGSDIQPIAIQIAKLRFFISLLVDQYKHTDRLNYGIRALPNLETNLVAANSLISISLPDQSDIFDRGIDDFKKKIKDIHNEYFGTRSRVAKKAIRAQEIELRQSFAKDVISLGTEENIAELIASWNPYASNEHASFFDPGIMFGIDGFYLVITNPPYIRQEDIPDKAALQASGYRVYNSTSDIYTYFYELAINLLKERGVAAFITSNKWMRAKYGLKLRELLAQEISMLSMIDFGGYQVFESATVNTNIAIFQKLPPLKKHQIPFLNIGSSFDGKNLESFFYTHHKCMPQSSLQSSGWTFADNRVIKLKEKIEAAGLPLKDNSVKVFRGILTGCIDSFIIDNESKDILCAEDPGTIGILKPVLKGRDISRYAFKWSGLWLLLIPSGWTSKNRGSDNAEDFFKKRYPAAYDHFIRQSQVQSRGRGLFDRGDQGDYWWELRDCAYYDEFEKVKIIWADIAQGSSFQLDNQGMFLDNTAYMMTGDNLEFILGVLNSSIYGFYYRLIASDLSGGAQRGFKIFIEQFPIPDIKDQATRDTIVNNVLLLSKSESLTDQEALEANQTINKALYQYYGLTDEEIQIVEGGGSGK